MDTEGLCALFVQTVHRFNQLEREVHTCGAGQSPSLAETHTIAAVGQYEHLNITQLAKLQGVSRSAASQMVSKLVKKELLCKKPSPQTENEVVLTLTEQGRAVWEAHRRQHARLQDRLEQVFARYPQGTREALAGLARDVQALWEELEEA